MDYRIGNSTTDMISNRNAHLLQIQEHFKHSFSLRYVMLSFSRKITEKNY